LGFDSKLEQVEEYVKYIQDEKFAHDENLLRDVRVMAEVHRDWAERAKQGLPDTVCRQGPSILPVSARLISAEALQDIQKEKDAMGVAIQMREDHPPFTVAFEEDQREFLKAMRDDACVDPVEVDENSNFLWVESRAYGWALREPAMIPLWLHPTQGIPKNGILPTEPKPWYRTAAGPQKAPGTTSNGRPPIQRLPDYLKKRQDWINLLLQACSDRTAEGQSKLEDLLRLHEPLPIRELHDKYLTAKYQRDILKRPGPSSTPENERVLQQALETSYAEFRKGFTKWLRSFERDGVQLMVLKPGVARQNVPGVFYLPPEYDVPQYKYVEVEYAQAYLRQIRLEGFSSLNAQEKRLLIEVLRDSLDDKAIAAWDEATAPGGSATEDDAIDVLAQSLFSSFLAPFASQYSDLRLLYPGELAGERKGRFYITWDFPKTEVLADADGDVNDVVPGVDLPAIQDEINRLLKKRGNLGMTLQENDKKRLSDLLEPFAHRPLRTKIYQAKIAKEKLKAQLGFFPSNKTEADKLEEEKKNMWNRWLGGFQDHEVTLKGRRPNEGDPGVLYWRDEFPAGENPTTVMKRNTVEINRQLLQKTKNDDKYYRALEKVLQHVQYPRIRNLARRTRDLAGKVMNTTPGIKQHQTWDLAESSRAEWNRGFRAWVETFRNFRIEVRANLDGNDWRGDPSTLFYHGPIKVEYPHYMYNLSVDPNTTLSDVEIAKARSLLNMGMAAGLDGVDLGMQVRHFVPLLLAKTLEWSPAYRDQVFVPNFEDWVARIRAYKAGPNGSHASHLISSAAYYPNTKPSVNKAMEIEINALLQKKNLSQREKDDLDKRVYRHWVEPHKALTEHLKAVMLSVGYSAQEIEDMDWTITGRCRGGFEKFKDECRRFGFKIIRAADEAGYIEYAVSGKPNQITAETVPNPEFLSASFTDSTGGGQPNPDTTTDEPVVEDAGVVSGADPIPISTPIFLPELLLKKQRKINDLMDKLNAKGFRFKPRGDTQIFAVRPLDESTDEAIRLWVLLRDFHPDEFRLSEWRIYAAILSRPNTSKRGVASMHGGFRKVVWQWIDNLLELGSARVVDGNGFNPLGESPNQIYYRESDARVFAIPAGTGDDIQSRTFTILNQLSVEELESDEEDDKFTPMDLTSLERQINRRLQQRKQAPLNYSDMLDLHCLLSTVMPQELRELHEKFLIIDQDAKSRPFSTKEAAEYYNVAGSYAENMTRWVDSFSPDGIVIGPSEDAGTISHAGVLYLNGNPQTIPLSAPSTVPAFIQTLELELNRWMKQPSDLAAEDQYKLDTIFSTLYQRYGPKYCQDIREELDTSFDLRGDLSTDASNLDKSEKLQPERASYTEARVDVGYLTWRLLLTAASANLTGNLLDFVETWPGRWEILFAPLDFDPDALAKAPRNRPDWMKQAEIDFLRLSRKVRLHEKLEPDERTEVEKRLEPISLDGVKDLELQLARAKAKQHYLETASTDGGPPITEQDKKELQEVDITYLWQRFGYMFPALREEILPDARVPDPVINLLYRNPRALQPVADWVVQPPAPPLLPQPTESGRLELQIEINNLLTQWKRKNIKKEEKSELLFLLQSQMMPVRLQVYRNQAQFLQRKSESDGGLSSSHSLRLMELSQAYSTSLNEWVDELAETGIILDSFWYAQEAVDEIFSNAMAWKRAQLATNGQSKKNFKAYPTLGHEYLDKDIGREHEVYAILRKYLDGGIQNGCPASKLLLEKMPPELKTVHDNLRQGFESLSTLDGQSAQDNNASQVHGLEEDFVKLYLDWYCLPEVSFD
jgi:hypothetical protein